MVDGKVNEVDLRSVFGGAVRGSVFGLHPRREKNLDPESDILHGLYTGMRNKDMANGFNLSDGTVEMYQVSMIEKLQATRLSKALHIAAEVALEPLTPPK